MSDECFVGFCEARYGPGQSGHWRPSGTFLDESAFGYATLLHARMRLEMI